MDRDESSSSCQVDVGYPAQAEIAGLKNNVSPHDVMLIAMSWAALGSFIVFPEVQVIAFGATLCGVAMLGRSGKDV